MKNKLIFTHLLILLFWPNLVLGDEEILQDRAAEEVAAPKSGSPENLMILNQALDRVEQNQMLGIVEDQTPQGLVTETFTLKHVLPGRVAEKVREMMGGAPGEVFAHDQEGELEVKASPELLDRVRTRVAQLDQEHDIVLDVQVVQIDLNDEHRSGINWSAIVSDYQSFVAADDNRNFSVGTISTEDFDVLLGALNTVGETKKFPLNSISNVSGQEADLRLKAFSQDVTVSLIPLVPLSGQIKEHQDRYSARLMINPNANGDDAVDLVISSANGTATVVRVRNDEIAVVGGVFTQTKQEYTKKFPLLGDLPVFGIVFRDQSRVVHRLENIIFITPRISSTSKK